MSKSIAKAIDRLESLAPAERLKERLKLWEKAQGGGIWETCLLSCLALDMDTETAQAIADEEESGGGI